MEQEPAQLFIEDFAEKQIYPGASRTITRDDVLVFAALTGDRHPIHYDAEYARTTRFGRPIVHGLHLMSLTALGATALSERLRDSMIAMLEQGARFLNPVFVDDTARSEFEVAEVEHHPGREWGMLKFAIRLLNQRDEIILEAHHVYRVRARTAQPHGRGS
jgi:3-hydroxybutyryl-CoA dehydratase